MELCEKKALDGEEMEKKPLYTISVAGDRMGVHPETLGVWKVKRSKGADLTNYEHMLIIKTNGGIPNGKANKL
jgi:hypothetical protein